MWTEKPRNLINVEKRWISRLNDGWSDEYLGAIEILEFIVDNAHTIRNAAIVKGRVNPISSELTIDGEGAAVEVILYGTETGDFGELEFNRLDTRPLMEIPQLST